MTDMKSSVEDQIEIGKRLRHLRTEQRLSLEKLGDLTGLSASFLSQLERGLVNASFGSLRSIASGLNISLSVLFSDDFQAGVYPLPRSARPEVAFGDIRKFVLTPHFARGFECFIGELDPGVSTGDEPYTHGDFQELFLVLRGQVGLEVDGAKWHLSAGDSIIFNSSLPHRCWNDSADMAEVMWIVGLNSLPAFSANRT